MYKFERKFENIQYKLLVMIFTYALDYSGSL